MGPVIAVGWIFFHIIFFKFIVADNANPSVEEIEQKSGISLSIGISITRLNQKCNKQSGRSMKLQGTANTLSGLTELGKSTASLNG